MDHFLHGYVPDTGTRKRVCRSSERTEQMETLPACRRPKLAYAAGSKQLADMAGSPISVEDIRQGTDFMSAVTLSNISGTSDYSNLALTHIIPSGWEIYNERMIVPEVSSSSTNEANVPESSAGKYTYKDIRDDRVLTYFDLRRGESKTFTVRLQATYAGNFILPAVQCEAMYDVNVQARSKAGRTTVSR